MQPKLSAKKIFLGVIALIAVVFFAGYVGRNVFKSKAAGEVVEITTNDVQWEKNSNEGFVGVFLRAPKSKGISAVGFGLTAKNIKLLDIPHITSLDTSDDTVFNEIKKTIAPDGSSIFKSAVAIQSDDKLPQGVGFVVQFACKSAGPATISFDPSKIEITGNIIGDTYEIAGGEKTLSINCTGTSGPTGPTNPNGPTVNAHFSPKSISSTVGSSFTTDFIMDGQPAGKAISSFNATIKYDPKLVEATNIGELSTLSLYGFLGSSAVNSPSSCTSDEECKICAGESTTMCKQGVCRTASVVNTGGGAGVCDFTNAAPPDMSCKTREDCIAKVKEMGSNRCDGPGECPITCNAAGQCASCTAGVNCTTSSPVPTTPPGDSPQPTTPPGSTGKCDRVVATNDTATGTIRIVYLCSMPSSQLPTSPSISLTFKSKALGSGALHVDSSTEIAGNIEGNGYLVNAEDAQYTIAASGVVPTSPAAGPTPTTAPGAGTGNVTLNLKLKFQGIEKKPADPYNSYMVKCSIGGRGNEEPVEATAEFKADDNGVWSGTLAYDSDIELGSDKKIFCKGPKHMQKKICDNVPTETFPGTYNPNCDISGVSLVEGVNNLDFSGIRLLVGDLPPQDGIANSADMSLIIKFFDQTTPEAIRAADLNGDGAVNAYDYSFMAGAFAHHLDDL